MATKRTHSQIGRQNKKKGANAEREAGVFWSEVLSSRVRRTPRSGAFSLDWPGDLVDMGNSIIKQDNWIIDIKCGKSAVPKKIIYQMEKLHDDAAVVSSRKYWLELVEEPRGEVYIILNKKVFAKLLKEIQDGRQGDGE